MAFYDLNAMLGLAGVGAAAVLPWSDSLRAYSLAMAGKADDGAGGAGDKILLPPSALDSLTRRQVQYPMMFRLSPPRAPTGCGPAPVCHAGVLEFTALEGRVHLPISTMRTLGLAEGAFLDVRNVQLPKARFVKFQPVTKDFISLRDPKAVLERQLRTFSAMTKGSRVTISHATKAYTLNVLECKPADAVCIIDADVEVDFAPPLDWVEPPKPALTASSAAAAGAIVIDDDEESPAPGLAAGSRFPALAPLGAALQPRESATAPPAFIGGSGTTGGGITASATSNTSMASLAAQAALKRAAAASAAAAAAPPPKFTRKEPPVFTGEGHRVGDSASVTSSGTAAKVGGVASSAATGGSFAGGGAAAGSTIAVAGGVVVSTGSAADAARPRTLNKFEAAKAAAAFAGKGHVLRG